MQSIVSRWRFGALLACLAIGGAVPSAPGAAGSAAAEPLELSALTGPQGADLYVRAPAGATVFEHLHIRIYASGQNGHTNRTVNLKDVAAPAGTATVDLGDVVRGAAVDVQAQVREQSPPRKAIHRGKAIVELRPDLVVAAIHAPPQTLSTRPIDVVAELSELNGDTGATATVKLMLGPTLVAEPLTATVPAGGGRSVTFQDVKLPTPMSAELTVVIDAADPAETDSTNNTRTTKVEVTEHELVRTSVLVPSLGGYGGQFNQHVYAPITNAPPASLPDLEAKAKALEPQLVRIFYNDNWEERLPTAAQNLASFIRTVQLAHESGATINITYQTASVARLDPVPSMTRFAAVLEDLVETRGLTNVRWVTVQNEPNTPGAAITLEQYNALYRALHAQLVTRGLREHVRLMGGDLIESSGARFHTIWWEYMEHNMNDILDAYSVHIYWNYWDIPRMEFRLKDVHRIVTQEIAPAAQKPTYVMEFGVRGANSFAGKPTVTAAYWEDGTELRKTNVAGFQQLWFNIASAQLGYTGASKWDAFWGVYDNTLNNQSYWMFGTAAEGWPIFPTYYALQLLLRSTERGWQVVRVGPWEDDDWQVGKPDEAEKELVAYASTSGSVTVMGLDTHARNLNTVSAEKPQYSIGGLPASTSFNLAYWNAAGNGESTSAGTVMSDAAGVARFEVPLHAAFSLTTVTVF